MKCPIAIGRGIGRRNTVIFLSIVTFVMAAAAARDGHDWGGDYAQYILHAQNILDGEPYSPIAGTIHNPYLQWMVPAYPPIYPLCIAAVVAVFGVNFVALKVQIAAFLALAVALYWPLARRVLPGRWAIGAVCFVAFAPYLLKFSNKVLSEIPYMAVSFAALIVAERFFSEKNWKSTLQLLIAMVAIAATRSVGLAFVVAVPAYALVAKRSHFVTSVLASLTAFLVLTAISWSMIGFYVGQSGMSIERVLVWLEGKPAGYLHQLGRYLALYPDESAPFAITLNTITAVIYLSLVSLGIYKKRKLRLLDAYLVIYLLTIYVFTAAKIRYLFPVIPLLSLHAFQGLRFVWVSISKMHWRPLQIRRWMPYAPALVYVPLFLAYLGVYTLKPVSSGANILNDPNVSDLFEHVGSNRQEISGLIFHSPRVMGLFTGVPATCAFNAEIYYETDVTWDLEKLLDLAARGGISHVILAEKKSKTCLAIGPIVDRNPGIFVQSYRNPGYRVYRIQQNVTKREPYRPEGPTDGKQRKRTELSLPSPNTSVETHSLMVEKS